LDYTQPKKPEPCFEALLHGAALAHSLIAIKRELR
jgi:hypothetical protein